MPVFDDDLGSELGMPGSARKLKALFAEHDGLIIASPEYNSSNTAALKNALGAGLARHLQKLLA